MGQPKFLLEIPKSQIRFCFDKTVNAPPLDLAQTITMPSNVDYKMSTDLRNPLKLEKNIRCVNCHKFEGDGKFFQLSYKYIIEIHD